MDPSQAQTWFYDSPMGKNQESENHFLDFYP